MIVVDSAEIRAIENGLRRIRNSKRKKERKKLLNDLKNLADEVRDLGYDYLIVGDEKIFLCERKTMSDMVSSIYGTGGVDNIKNRFFTQLERIIEVAKELREETGKEVYPIFIAEGSEYVRYRARYARMTRAQWFGIQVRLAEMGVYLIKTGSLSDTLIALRILEKHAGAETRKTYAVIKSARQLRKVEDEVFGMLLNIKGLGEVKVKKLIDKYGSIEAIMGLSKEKLIAELGNNVGSHVYEVLRTDVRKQKKLIG